MTTSNRATMISLLAFAGAGPCCNLLGAEAPANCGPAFINDQIWLLFPLHVSWDGSADVEDTGMHNCRWGRVPASGSP
jgi:hypothetical protein